MKRRAPQPRVATENPADIDARYGLEPVFEPGEVTGKAGLAEFAVVECPYCAESFETAVDLTAGSTTAIEDCHVCCQPIEIETKISVNGQLKSLTARRLD